MKLYHGTNMVFDHIDLKKSKPGKDFGPGFYLSDNMRQAKDLAQARVVLAGGVPTVLTYEFDERLLTRGELKVLSFKDYTREWAEFIIANRNNHTCKPAHDYYIVIGPIANDKVGLQLWKFSNHDIDMGTLIERLKYMKGITMQYYFGTQRAINHLMRL